MITEVIDESSFKRVLALWMLENDRGTVLPEGMSKEEFAEDYPIPDTLCEHTQSAADGDGNVITLLKAEICLRDWETKNGRESKTFTYYRVLKTFSENPDSEPFPIGYIAAY